MRLFAIYTILMLSGHGIADHRKGLQPKWLSYGKNRLNHLRWYYCLALHSTIHGAMVLLVTGSVALALAEITCHSIIDYNKWARRISMRQDQGLHVACKLVWAVIATLERKG